MYSHHNKSSAVTLVAKTKAATVDGQAVLTNTSRALVVWMLNHATHTLLRTELANQANALQKPP